jgi:hypothetical protein
VRRDGRALLAVSIEDRDTGATFEWAVRKDRVAMAALPPDGKGRDRLWRDGCRIVGLAHRGGGRPPGLTTIAEDDELRKPIGEMRRDRRRTTLRNVAAYSGFTVSEIRGYLRVTDRTWAEFLSSF